MPQGEKGILEAYLRGFASAKEFIYLETQYFTNDAIGDGLVNALLSEPKLKVIVLLNIEPDVPTYPFKQRRLITRIRRAIGQTPTGPQRFGVFTRWTHESVAERVPMKPADPPPDPQTKDPRPRLLPIYVHAKVGIIDNTWATVGSANLDGLSLDSSLPSDILNGLFHRNEQRAIEVNGVFFDTKAPPNNVVDILRRKLWAEHLGFLKPDGTPTSRPILQVADKPPEGWLTLWSDRAKAMLQHLINTPAQSSNSKARVLPWPTDNSTHKTPRDHMDALGVAPDRIYRVAPLKSTAAFDFKTGTWDQEKKNSQDGLLMASTIDRAPSTWAPPPRRSTTSTAAHRRRRSCRLLGWAPPPGVDDIGLAQLDVSILEARLDELIELRSHEQTSDADLALGIAAVVGAVADAYDGIEQIVASFQATPEYWLPPASAISSSVASPTC